MTKPDFDGRVIAAGILGALLFFAAPWAMAAVAFAMGVEVGVVSDG